MAPPFRLMTDDENFWESAGEPAKAQIERKFLKRPEPSSASTHLRE